MKEFEITCPLTREPRLKEIEARAGGMKWVLKKRSVDVCGPFSSRFLGLLGRRQISIKGAGFALSLP